MGNFGHFRQKSVTGKQHRNPRAASVAMSCALSVLLAVALVPIGAITLPKPTYASDGNGGKNAPVEEIITEGLSDRIASESAVGADGTGDVSAGGDIELSETPAYLVVKNTLVDASVIPDGAGFDEIYSSEEMIGNSIIGQFETFVPVYDPGEQFPYRVAFAGSAKLSSGSRILDYAPAELNVYGEILDDVEMDMDSGVVYIPKSHYDGNDGHVVQVQLLCTHDFSDAESTVDVRIDNENPRVTAPYKAQSVSMNPLDVTISAQIATEDTASAISVEDIEVRLNGDDDPLDSSDSDQVRYDPSTGVLEVGGNPSGITSMDVKIERSGSVDKAHAISGHSAMKALHDCYGNEAVLSNLDPDLVSVGQMFSYHGMINYFSDGSTSVRRASIIRNVWPYLYVNAPSDAGTIHSTILNNGSLNYGKLINPADSGYAAVGGDSGHGGALDIVNTFDWPNAQRVPGTLDPDEKDWPLYSYNNVINGVDWSGFPRTTDESSRAGWQGVAQCAHNFSNGSASAIPGGTDSSVHVGTIKFRVLVKADDYLVLGFVCPTMNTQTGAAVYKIKYESKGQLEIRKSSSNTTFTNGNSNYSLSGAVYGVYSDAACTKEAARLTTDANGYAKSGDLKSGTYYVKEITAPKGYKVDSASHSVSVPSGGIGTATLSDVPQSGKVRISKGTTGLWSKQYATYSLAGAQYEVKDQKGKVWATLVTDAAGTATSMDLPLGTYTLSEKSAPTGYRISITPINISVTADGSVNTGTDLDAPTVRHDPDFGAKVDYNASTTGHGYVPQGGASLASATYQLSYYDGYYTSLSQLSGLAPKKVSEMTTVVVGGKALLNATAANMENDGSSLGLPLGTYKLVETKAPEGYTLDPTVHVLQVTQDSARNGNLYIARDSGGSYLGQSEGNPGQKICEGNLLVTAEQAQRGDFSLMKYVEDTTDPDRYPDQKRPAAGVQFEIVNDNDYDVQRVDTGEWVSKGGVVYTLTTDEQGYASTRHEMGENGWTGIQNNNDGRGQAPNALAFGSYIVREVPETTPDGYVPIEDYHFSISANYSSHHQVFENKTGTVVRVVKTDVDSHASVRGLTKVRILDADMNPVEFDEPYPSGSKMSVLTTGIDGTVVLPAKLMKGTYYVEEVEAPEGYLHNPEPVRFEVDSSTVNDYDHPMDVKISDVPAMGRMVLGKHDASTGGLITASPATYEVFAAEDIVTPDGSVRAKNGELVDTISTDETGTAATKRLHVGKYRAVEKTAPMGYLADAEPVEFEIPYGGQMKDVADKDVLVRIDVSDKAVLGSVSVLKTDISSNLPIKFPAVFDVRAAENIVSGDGHVWHVKGETVATLTTDGNGSASTAQNLRLGKYEVVEKTAPYGYVLSTEPVPVELKYADQNTPIVSAQAVSRDLMSSFDFDLAKLDRETGKNVLVPGCRIGIYAAEDIVKGDGIVVHHRDDFIGFAETDETGKTTSSLSLPAGKYYLIEQDAPMGYVLDMSKKYPVETVWDDGENENVINEASISDMPAKGVIELSKVDAETGRIVAAAGIKAEVYATEDIVTGDGTVRAKQGDKVADLETDGTGTARTPELYLGDYRVVETAAPAGYLVNEIPVDVSLVYEGQSVPVVTASAEVRDANVKGVIEITKIDKDTGKAISVPGAVFEVRAKTDIVTADGTVRASAGELVDTVSTGIDGKGQTKQLYLGTYTITETVAPAGYTIDSTPHDAVLAYKDQTTPIVFASESIANAAQKGVVQVTKVDADSGLPLLSAGTEFEIRALEDIYTPDGTLRSQAGEVVDTIFTGENGTASSKALFLGKYEIRETKAPAGYLLSDEVKHVELTYGEQSESLVYAMESIADHAVKGAISIHKEDSDLHEPLANVEYEIRATEDIITGDGVVHHKAGDIVETIKTDEAGNATSSELYLGEYAVAETVQPNGYELDTKEYPVHLEYAGQSVPVVHEDMFLYNTPTAITIEKVSSSSPAAPVPGTKFAGWEASDEADTDCTFAVFSETGIEIEGASVEYLGGFSQIPEKRETQNSFELAEALEAAGYEIFSSKEPVEQGDYVLHLSYNEGGTNVHESVPFSVNENDSGAFFAVGKGIVGAAANGNFDRETVVPNAEENVSGNENGISVERVPAVLSHGRFIIAETGDNGTCTFSHVPQGRIIFAELSPAGGYVSDRTPDYVEIDKSGYVELPEGSEEPPDVDSGNISDKNVDLVFRDDVTKLLISKRDVATSEELPGNVLSVYEFEGDGIGDEVSDADYGELIETWTSTSEPHYMELLPQGDYILKEETAAEGYTVAESIVFRLNDTSVEQQIVMGNEHEAGLAGELVESSDGTGTISGTGDLFPFALIVLSVSLIASGLVIRRRAM